MKLKQGIDIDITTQGKSYSLEMVSFPFYSHNKQPNRSLIFSKKKLNFNIEDPNLNDNLLDFIIKNTPDNFDTTYFTTANSQAHYLLKDSVLNNQLQVSGLLEQNKTIPKTKKSYNFFENTSNNKSNNESKNDILIDLDFFSHKVFKATELSISAYDTYQDLVSQKNPIFSFTEVKNKKTNAIHDYFKTSIFPHIKKFQEEGKNIQIHTTSKNFPFMASLNQYLKDSGLKTINIKFKKENETNKMKSQNNISNQIKKEYDNLLELEDKHVIYTDGGILNEGRRNESISSAFIFTEQLRESQGHDSFLNKHKKGSNYSELYAVKLALQFVIDNNKFDKPLHIVFDSDFASQQIQNIMQGNNDLLKNNKENQIIEDVKQLIENHNINIADTIVLKSHQDFSHKHQVVKFNEKVDKLVKLEGYKKIKKHQY